MSLSRTQDPPGKDPLFDTYRQHRGSRIRGDYHGNGSVFASARTKTSPDIVFE
jgi:hypothetical protein